MQESLVRLGPALAVTLAVLAATAAAVGRLGGLGTGRPTLTAGARAALQLAAVSFVVALVVRSLPLSATFVGLMAVIATGTSARRVTREPAGWWVALAVAPAPLVTAAALVGVGVIPPEGLAVVPTAGILIGGAMTATTLAGTSVLAELRTRRGEYEAALSIGLDRRSAALEISRRAASSALLPALDQTRTVGLVTLPGAYVGLLLAGASPVEAGAAQLLVLVALLAVESVAVVVVLELVAAGLLQPGSPGSG